MTPGRTCPRYAVIDLGTGFICGVVDATDIFSAVRKVAGAQANLVEIADGGFIVHLVPDDFAVGDGTDQEAIDAVERMPVAGYLRSVQTDENQ